MIPLIFIFALMLLFKSRILEPLSNADQSVSIALGFILLFAFLVGKQVKRLNLPQITGFILAGIVCGPFVMNFLSLSDVRNLQLLDGLALSLIALTAGGEMNIHRLRGRLRSILSLVGFQTFLIVTGFIILGLLGRAFFFPGHTVTQSFVFALLLGTLATATSPSTTIAIITETRSGGASTDLILGGAVVKDFFVIVFFAVALAISRSLLSPGQGFDGGFLAEILAEIGGSLLIGGLVGAAIVLYLKYIGREITVFVLSIAFLTYQISHSYGFHPLMSCLVAGFIAENFSAQGDKLIQAIERSSVPVYVVFFAISGASLDLDSLRTAWVIALVFFFWRGGLKFAGTYLGARMCGEDPLFRKYGWAGFLSQAGVALGMAIIIERSFPEWGGTFKAVVLAVIALNQIIGPVLLQKFLIRCGEAGRKG